MTPFSSCLGLALEGLGRTLRPAIDGIQLEQVGPC